MVRDPLLDRGHSLLGRQNLYYSYILLALWVSELCFNLAGLWFANYKTLRNHWSKDMLYLMQQQHIFRQMSEAI